jgi:hypothetical protein
MTAPPAFAKFAIVGHPNKGKSSIVATLSEDEAVAIAPQPGTTTRSTSYPMRLDGEVLYELIDTPGFQRAREVLDWLIEHDEGADARADTVRRFLETHADDPRFHDECELLKPVMDGAGILYVVDGSRPYARQYEAEMEILRRTGQPRMALINLIGSGDHVDEWQSALGQYFSIVRVFDAVRADFAKRIELLRAFAAIEERGAQQLNRAADALIRERERRGQRAARAIADMLVDVLTASVRLPLPNPDAPADLQEKARTELKETIRRREQEARRAVQQIYRHADTVVEEKAQTPLTEDAFSQRSFRIFGLSREQLAVTGAAGGAAAGGLIDVAVGGSSLLLGTGIGALIGAAGALGGARQLAQIKVLGRPIGGYELVVGPVTDPNVPWVLLARALLHVRLVAERNHARRDQLVLEAETNEGAGKQLSAARRAPIETLFRQIRKQRGDDAETREKLAEAINNVIDTP